VAAVAATVVLLGTGTAAAQQGAWKNELSGGMGFAVGISDWAPGGFMMENEYGRKLTNLVWLNVQLNFVLGGGEHCHWSAAYDAWVCEGNYRWSGDGLQMIGGVKFKWRMGKLQPHAKVGAGLSFSFWGGDVDGTALVARGGGGVKFWVIPRLAVGGEVNFTLGPNFIHHGDTEFFAALDFIAGVEFAF
jgi:hypothetical protein